MGSKKKPFFHVLGTVAAGDQFRALFQPGLHVALHLVALLFADERAEHRRRVPGVADDDVVLDRVHAFEVGIHQVLGHEQACLQHAALAAVGEHGAETDLARHVFGNIVEHHLGALAAEFELHALYLVAAAGT